MQIRVDFLKQFTLAISFILTILLWRNTCYSQDKYFQLTGRVKGLDTGIIKINFLLTDSAIKRSFTTKINKGKFFIREKIAHPMRGYMILNGSIYSDDFFIEPGKQDIYFDATTRKSFHQSIKINGSVSNEEFMNDYQKKLQPFYDKLDNCYEILDSLNKLFTIEKPPSVYSGPCRNIELAIGKIDSVKKAFIIKHPSSYVSLWGLVTSIWGIDNLEFVAETFKSLDSKIRSSVVGKWLAERIETQSVFLNGKIFPAMILGDSNQKKFTIRDSIRGEYTLVDFWFSHCGPCIAQFPLMSELYTKYKDLGFDIIGISIDQTVYKKDWLEIIAKHHLNWRQYWDVDGEEASRFYFDSYPTNFLLDKEGKIIKKNILMEELGILLSGNLK